VADCRSSSDSTERPLDQAQQPSRLEGPVWIVERPLSTGERPTVDDPLLPVAKLGSGRSRTSLRDKKLSFASPAWLINGRLYWLALVS